MAQMGPFFTMLIYILVVINNFHDQESRRGKTD